jgi:hypothetical protein
VSSFLFPVAAGFICSVLLVFDSVVWPSREVFGCSICAVVLR